MTRLALILLLASPAFASHPPVITEDYWPMRRECYKMEFDE